MFYYIISAILIISTILCTVFAYRLVALITSNPHVIAFFIPLVVVIATGIVYIPYSRALERLPISVEEENKVSIPKIKNHPLETETIQNQVVFSEDKEEHEKNQIALKEDILTKTKYPSVKVIIAIGIIISLSIIVVIWTYNRNLDIKRSDIDTTNFNKIETETFITTDGDTGATAITDGDTGATSITGGLIKENNYPLN